MNTNIFKTLGKQLTFILTFLLCKLSYVVPMGYSDINMEIASFTQWYFFKKKLVVSQLMQYVEFYQSEHSGRLSF